MLYDTTSEYLHRDTVPSSCYPAPSLEPIFGQYLGSRGSTDDQKMCVNQGWCPTFQ